MYESDLPNFFSDSRLAWYTTLKMTKVKLDILSDIDMLLMVEESIRGGICHFIYRYAKANKKM